MLRIRREHKDAFHADAVAELAERLAEHLRRFFPELCAPLDAGALDARIRDGMRRAEARGMINERDLAMFVDVALTRGEGFESEPWASAILEDDSLETPTDRAEALFEAAFAEEPSP